MHVTDWLQRRASLSPNKVALIDRKSGSHVTYTQWNQQTNQLAHFVQSVCGIQKSDRIAILAKNSIAYLDTWMACGKLGAILQNLNWRLAVQEQIQLLEDARPKVLLYSTDFLAEIHTLQEACPWLEHWIALDAKAREEDLPIAQRETYPRTSPPWPQLQLDDPWVLCYTGGTTGLPKGAILSHGNIWANAINTAISWGLDAHDVAILNAPLFHTGGLNVFTSPLVYLGGTSIVCEAFDPDDVFDMVEHSGVTVFFGVPTMFVMMQEHPRWPQADFSRLKFVISGGAPCPLPVFEKFWAKDVEFKTGYGLTEAGPNTFWLPSEYVREKPGAVGVPLMHIDLKLVDTEGQEVAAGEVGELLIRGPHVTQGYWNRPAETAAALRDGWLSTGDLARCDEDGFYSIVGRRKEMIISGGENIYPAEIESVLHGHPNIAEAAVIGLPDDKWGEIPAAILRTTPETSLSTEQVIEYCRQHLARYKIPKRIFFVEELPKTGAGKIDKTQLSKQFAPISTLHP